MKCIQIPRVYVNEDYEMELIYKKLYVTEKEDGKYIRFPVEIYDEETEEDLHGEIYELNTSSIRDLFNSALNEVKQTKSNAAVSNGELSVSISNGEKGIYELIVKCEELGEEGEDIVAIEYIKEEKRFDEDSFGIELMLEVAKEELEKFVDVILKGEL